MLWFYQSSFQSEQFILTSPNHDMRTLIGWNTLHIFIVYKHDSLGLAANRGLPKWPIFKILCAISSIWLTFEPSQANILRCWAIFNGQILKKQSSHLVGLAIREFRTHWRQVRSIFKQILSRRTSNVDLEWHFRFEISPFGHLSKWPPRRSRNWRDSNFPNFCCCCYFGLIGNVVKTEYLLAFEL